MNDSPLLFWTIVFVAAQHSVYDTLYEQLHGPHERLLSQSIHIAMGSAESVHALLILCSWPVPKLRRAYDPSWTYVGIAIHNAINMGLHRPCIPPELTKDWRGYGGFLMSDFSIETQVLTWLGCFSLGVR